ncbi:MULTISPECIES: hypothetical protein [Mesorhizobium]|uniref:hypothetical protein n=1 Tax=Mesorhizobium TaxID=68287 RepID=UPI0007A93986|nr:MULTISPECIES: hypothetical protein [Mesorhizobium]AMX93730.1 hypothetical protein A4R28_11760 [Mesorhizobium ciceri]MDF3208430.1 hypothetical protein [Mesorhizobium sp. LMG15046]MDF3228999.1 hypothetical protein [Mesorhizobium sp. DSM 30133]RUU22116.1 hypothetical protein EOC84_03125 [Mesorhizobium sp. Primo-B]RUU37974.1 hypothetical protein EOC83_17090 [Mesorhizobium sp. Primo-A]
MPTREQFTTEEEFVAALRDWFAGQALAGLLASWSLTDDIRFVRMSNVDRMKMFAFNSYMQADAMLAERQKP